jgi:peptidoglycan hydrolase CwlO-like protein
MDNPLESCETVEIQTELTEANPSGVVIINASDYDETTMKLIGDFTQTQTAKEALLKAGEQARVEAQAAKDALAEQTRLASEQNSQETKIPEQPQTSSAPADTAKPWA